MRILDLRTASGNLDPLASFRLLAVMCHPTDEKSRDAMMRHVRRGTGVGWANGRVIGTDQFMLEVDRHARRGGLAGRLLLTMLQLHKLGLPCSLEDAVALVAPDLPRWEQPIAPNWNRDVDATHIPHSRRKIRDAFHQFWRAMHLWAADIHGREHCDASISTASNSSIPRFLAYADAFAELGAKLPWEGRGGPLVLHRNKLCNVLIPPLLIQSRAVVALPLHPDQIGYLRTSIPNNPKH